MCIFTISGSNKRGHASRISVRVCFSSKIKTSLAAAVSRIRSITIDFGVEFSFNHCCICKTSWLISVFFLECLIVVSLLQSSVAFFLRDCTLNAALSPGLRRFLQFLIRSSMSPDDALPSCPSQNHCSYTNFNSVSYNKLKIHKVYIAYIASSFVTCQRWKFLYD